MPAKQNSNNCAMSRCRRNVIILLLILAVMLLSWLDHSFIKASGLLDDILSETRQSRSSDIEKYHAGTFTVINVVDGDTLDIDIPDGREQTTRIRLWGIDTPETKSEEFGVMYFGPQAYEYTKDLCLGKQVRIYLDENKDTRDKYGRLLAYVQLPNGRFLNEVLLSEGFAYADTRFDHIYYNKYNQLESAARSAERGLWKNVTPQQYPQWMQERDSNQ